ncbi:unannotated protein [freshwater metagenome]|uniref:Unannotated protein n=1 Tax=freshwater metagenome TaxID=449393 RepID=A0A6J7JKX8_9ZZZZ|nr:DUF4236 domain-containing protein [Actinomycetota bacterium]
MGLRINRRVKLGQGFSANLGKSGVSVSKRSKRGSVNSRGTGTVRLMRGVSWMFGKRR